MTAWVRLQNLVQAPCDLHVNSVSGSSDRKPFFNVCSAHVRFGGAPSNLSRFTGFGGGSSDLRREGGLIQSGTLSQKANLRLKIMRNWIWNHLDLDCVLIVCTVTGMLVKACGHVTTVISVCVCDKSCTLARKSYLCTS